MSLQDLKENIYQQKQNPERIERAKRPWLKKFLPNSQPPQTDITAPAVGLAPVKKKWSKKIWILIIAGAVLLVASISVGAYLYWKQNKRFFNDTKIDLQIEAIDKITSGDEVTYRVHASNASPVTLKGLELTFYFPESALIQNGDPIQNLNWPDLAPGQNTEAEFKAIIVGNKGDQKEARAILSFQPSNINSRFQKEAKITTGIILQPLVLDIELPARISKNQPFNFSVECLNTSEMGFSNLALKIQPPTDFILLASQPAPDQDQKYLWPIDTLKGGGRFKISGQGKIDQVIGEMMTFKIQVGRWQDEKFDILSEILEKTQVTLPALDVSQKINNQLDEYIANPGDSLLFQIDYQNTTDIALPEIVLKAKLDGKIYDFDSLNSPEAFFDRASQTITWNSHSKETFKLLGASGKGQVQFSIRLKPDLIIQNFSDQNFSASSLATCDSGQVPFDLQNMPIHGEALSQIKIRSQITLHAKAYYRNSPISNTGPIPPKPHQKTTYTIVWQLVNLSNDVNNIEVKAKLPSHVTWENKISPTDAIISYNPVSGEVTWKIDQLLANTGALRPVQQAAFQISIAPADNHVRQTLTLIGQSQASGTDAFTQDILTSQNNMINTSLPDDYVGQPGQGVVTQ